jgi:NADPH:quinone reductase
MIAIEIKSFGAPNVLIPVERPRPKAGRGEVCIRMEAAGVSRADTMQRQGNYPPPPGASDIPGLDVAGTVEEVGEGVQEFRPGDQVCTILTGGGYAEFCIAPAEQTLPIPNGWNFIEAATLPENLFTVYDNLITRAGLKASEAVLIHGGTSGIGSMGIMLSRAWGAVPFATSGNSAKCDACLSMGAKQAINYKETDFVEEIKRFTADRGVDVVLDLVGGSYLDRNLRVLATEGRISVVAVQGGRSGELDILKLMMKRGRIIGSTMRVRSPAEKGEIAKRLLRDVWPLLEQKKFIRPIIDSVYPLPEARRAHERMESGDHIGKIVLIR